MRIPALFSVLITGVCVHVLAAVGWLSYLAQRRDSTLRLLALLQFIAIALTSMVMLHDNWSSDLKFKLMCGALALWGMVNVSVNVCRPTWGRSMPPATCEVRGAEHRHLVHHALLCRATHPWWTACSPARYPVPWRPSCTHGFTYGM